MAGNDYHIYIHGTGGGTSGGNSVAKEQTTPIDNRPSTSDSIANFISTGASSVESFASSGFESAVSFGVSMVSSASPWAALIVGAGILTEHTLRTGFGHLETYTGNYQYAMALNNVGVNIRNTLNPIGYAMKQARFQNNARKEQYKIDEERTLIGNSMFNKVKVGI